MVDPAGTPTSRYSIVVTPDGHPHILSVVEPSTLRYSYRDATGWHRAVLSDRFDTSTEPCLMNTRNFLHAAFFETILSASQARIRYLDFAKGLPGVLLTDEVVTSVSSPAEGSLCLATPASAQPQIAYTIAGMEGGGGAKAL